MKQKLLIFLLCIPLILSANMASPINRGSLCANPFLSENVNVLRENILIDIDDTYKAKFTIDYYIEAEKEGINIPLLFYAMGYDTNFTIYIDGKKVALKTVEAIWLKNDSLTNYKYLYTHDKKELATINIPFEKGMDYSFKMKEFFYFETNLSKGEHHIKVTYNADPWFYKHSQITSLSYFYALAPAKFWKSFGTLDITINTANSKEKYTTNLGELKEKQTHFHFKKLPTEVLRISRIPQLSGFTKFLMNVGYFNLALLLFIPFILLHIWLIKKYREKNSQSRISTIAILGGLALPFLFVFLLIISALIIDASIGKYASGRESYGVFYSFYLLIYIIPMYLIATLVVDYLFKRKYKTHKTI